MDLSVMSPMDYYTKEARAKHEALCEEHFQDLLSKSRIDVNANREAAEAYRAQMKIVDALNGKIRKLNVLRGFMIAFMVIAAVAAIVVAVIDSIPIELRIIIPTACAIIFTVLLLVVLLKINKLIRGYDLEEDGEREKANRHLARANEIIAPLIALFREDDVLRLIEKTLPSIKFERRLSTDLVEDMSVNYDFSDFSEGRCSSVDTVSGRISGNPFFFDRLLEETLGTETYHGYLTIHWTTTYRDSDGKMRTRHHSQTLHATVTKPKPYYSIKTRLHYGNQAAPDLSFSRDADHVEDLSEKKLERLVKSGEGKLAKRARESLEEGGNFTEMANTKFEVLFDALDRDHEQQFRLMFTPLAQNDMVKLITSEEGYGDDFAFIKRRRHNVIISEHMQSWVMDTHVSNYASYDVDILHTKFISCSKEYFKSVYFDFAPLLTVPAYQHAPVPSMAKAKEDRAYTHKEYEVVANEMGRTLFAHPDTATDVVLKTEHVATYGGTERVEVTAYSWGAIPRLDYVPMFGGDGRMHSVPVHWVEYYPLERVSQIEIRDVRNAEDEDFRDKRDALSRMADLKHLAFKHGLFARHADECGATIDQLAEILALKNKNT